MLGLKIKDTNKTIILILYVAICISLMAFEKA